jgi:hypothetical protein
MIGGRMLRRAAAITAVTLLAGCGAQAQAPPKDLEWLANARGVVEQLRADVIAVSAYDRPAAAKVGLRDESQLYGLLVAYTDFGGCGHMVAAVGAEPSGRGRVVELLRRACVRLRRADRLFTRAVARRAPLLLASATREAIAATPLLDAAALRIASARRGASET